MTRAGGESKENGGSDRSSGDLIGFVSQRFGFDAVRKIEEAFGGRAVYLPVSPQHHHVFTKVVGLDTAEIIAKEFGCGSVDVPLGWRRRGELIEAACLGDRTAPDIAKAFRCSTRWVHMKRADLRRQGRLK